MTDLSPGSQTFAASCDFGALKVGMIRNRIVACICNAAVQDRMLREKDLTLQAAIRIGVSGSHKTTDAGN